jgi:hypothetical protein
MAVKKTLSQTKKKSIPTDGHYRETAHHYGVLIQAHNECNHIL